MAYNKKLIHFKSKENFMSQDNGVGSEENITTPTEGSEEDKDAIYGQIKGTSIVFVKDSKEIWTHGNLYKSVNWTTLAAPPSPYTMVDLGLSVKWANMNVGAISPEDAGLYFQWGDTVGYTAEQVDTDKVFNFDNYFDTTDGGSTFTKYNTNGGLTTLEAADDAATVHMGGSWRMPTLAEIEELINGTTKTFIDMDGNEVISTTSGNLKGVRFTASNGNSIFIPAVGCCENVFFNDMGSGGYLWSSSLDNVNASDSSLAYHLGSIYNGYCANGGEFRYYGLSVRGVCE